jgi:hypothetical protein
MPSTGRNGSSGCWRTTARCSSGELSEAITAGGESVCQWLAGMVRRSGSRQIGLHG